jgi:hypothetical protein
MVPAEAHKKENYQLKSWSKILSSRDMSLEDKNNNFKQN